MNKNLSDSLSKTRESRAIEVMLQLSCGKVKNLEVQPIDLVFVQIKKHTQHLYCDSAHGIRETPVEPYVPNVTNVRLTSRPP